MKRFRDFIGMYLQTYDLSDRLQMIYDFFKERENKNYKIKQKV